MGKIEHTPQTRCASDPCCARVRSAQDPLDSTEQRAVARCTGQHPAAVTRITLRFDARYGATRTSGIGSRQMANRSSSHPGVNMKERSGWALSRAKVQDLSVPNRLIDSPVLSNLSLERLFGVEARAHIRHPEGSILFGEGQRAVGVYIIMDGRIKVSIG